KEWRLLNVSRFLIPSVEEPCRRRDQIPERILLRKIRIEPSVSFGIERALHDIANLVHRGPDVAKVNILTIFAAADRLLRQIDIDPSRERERYDQRRRHQEVGADRLMDARFEVAIAAEHRDSDQVVLRDR